MTAKEWNKQWKEFWKPLLLTKGEFNEKKIKNEMHDLVFIYEQVSEVYCYITGNLLSKPMYYAETIKSAFDDAVTEAAEFEKEDHEIKALEEAIVELEKAKKTGATSTLGMAIKIIDSMIKRKYETN